MSKSRATAGALALSVATVAGVGLSAMGAGTASAVTEVTSTTVYTLAGNGFCAGVVEAGLGHYPGQVDLGFSGTLIGVGPCSVNLDFVFRSRADGHVTTFTRTLRGPGGVGDAGRDVVSPGKEGVYDVTVTPRAPHVGGQKLTIDTTYRG